VYFIVTVAYFYVTLALLKRKFFKTLLCNTNKNTSLLQIITNKYTIMAGRSDANQKRELMRALRDKLPTSYGWAVEVAKIHGAGISSNSINTMCSGNRYPTNRAIESLREYVELVTSTKLVITEVTVT
jgi:hypothetical protein